MPGTGHEVNEDDETVSLFSDGSLRYTPPSTAAPSTVGSPTPPASVIGDGRRRRAKVVITQATASTTGGNDTVPNYSSTSADLKTARDLLRQQNEQALSQTTGVRYNTTSSGASPADPNQSTVPERGLDPSDCMSRKAFMEATEPIPLKMKTQPDNKKSQSDKDGVQE